MEDHAHPLQVGGPPNVPHGLDLPPGTFLAWDPNSNGRWLIVQAPLRTPPRTPLSNVIRYDPARPGRSLHIPPRSEASSTQLDTTEEQQQELVQQALIDCIHRRHEHNRCARRFWDNQRLFEAREVRHLAGLNTYEIDTEIARRVLIHPEHVDFRAVGSIFMAREWCRRYHPRPDARGEWGGYRT
jgi:hypothetical protein